MQLSENNFAFIDSQNLNLAIRSLGWQLDFGRFRKYLKEKYGVTCAYLFIGYVKNNQNLYKKLQDMGYICIFKPTLVSREGLTKGNCDAELVLHTMIQYDNFDRAIIVSGDGDFYCLVKYLLEKDKLKNVIVPNSFKFSALLRSKILRPFLRYMNNLRCKLMA